MCEWYKSGNYRSYAPRRIINSSMNICWSCLNLGKSLLIALNSVMGDGFLEGTGILGSWESCCGKVGPEQGNWREESTEVQKERDWQDKGKKEILNRS